MREATLEAAQRHPDKRIGIHCHNDIGCAVASTMLAVEAGATHVQGTFNGIGERCGNADLSVVIPNLQLKMGRACVPDLTRLAATAMRLGDIANMAMPGNKPYVGASAFAHKGGMHIDGVLKETRSFEHVAPESVGNHRRFLMSEVSGRNTVLAKFAHIAPELTKDSPQTRLIVDKLKDLEHRGYQFEAADASFELLILQCLGRFTPHFHLSMYRTNGEFPPPDAEKSAFAVLSVEVDDRKETTAAMGNGPVHALDTALRKALTVFYPDLSRVRLTDYKVRVLSGEKSTAAVVRVLIESTDGKTVWTTVGVDNDIIAASWQALADSIEYILHRWDAARAPGANRTEGCFMGMRMTQKILAAHCGRDTVTAGEIVLADVDMVLGNDITSPVAINEFEKAGCDCVFCEDRISLVLDHFAPNKDIKAAEQSKKVRTFAGKHGIANFFDVGEMGVEHALLPEKGLVTAGDLVIGADSHTCTYGALGAFSTGVGSTDMAAGMATGKVWLRVPEAIRVTLTGAPPRYVGGKDVILHIIGMIGVDGALYQSLEFTGPGVAALTMDDRLCVCNMAIEAGGKNGIFPVDGVTLEYLKAHGAKEPKVFSADPDAPYAREIEVDLSTLTPLVAFPHLPENVKKRDEYGDVPIDQVVVGSCTNGRLSDLAAAAEVLRGRRVAKGVRAIIIPATQKIYRDAMKAGYFDIFLDAGCAVSTPTCGPCLGGHMGILAKGEKCVATTNRNFVGRMGHPESEVYLAGPWVAAASAVLGRIAAPDELP